MVIKSPQLTNRKGTMKKNITMEEAIDRILIAVEYYDMVHDTGEEEQTNKNIDYVWKGYDRLIQICNEKKTNKKGTMTNKLQEKINDYLKKIIKADDDNEAQNITYDYDVEVLPQEEYDKIEQMMKEKK